MFKLKNQVRESFRPHDSFVVRNPLLPVTVFFDWKNEPGTPTIELRRGLRNALRELFRQPVMQEALYIASPQMYERSMLWLADKIDKPDKKERIELSLIKYFSRMNNRCTPYGLMATNTTGVFGDVTNIQLNNKENIKRLARPDMDLVCEWHSQLIKLRTISSQLLFSPNNSVYRCGNQLRYIEQRFHQEKGRSYHLVEIDHSPHLEQILNLAESGQKPSALAELITSPEISSAEALDFIFELIDSQLLVDELSPRVTGNDYFSFLVQRLKELDHTEGYLQSLDNLGSLFKQLMNPGKNEYHELYQEIVNELSNLTVSYQPKSAIQVDSYRPASCCSLNKKIGDKILEGIHLLALLAGEKDKTDPFEDFKMAFRKRYDDQWIPLVEVLDSEWGIGYGKLSTNSIGQSPLVDKLPIGNGRAGPQVSGSRITESFKWQLYEEAIEKNKKVVFINDSMIEQLAKEDRVISLPDSLSAMVKVHAKSANEIDKDNYAIEIQSVAGPSGANLLGRFCYLDPGIEKMTRSILEEEEEHHIDCIYAEIVHLPESRTGNILMRPGFRKHEIPYLCNSASDKEFQIPVTDLLVGIEADKIILWSRKLDKQVSPRLTTAHNYNLTTLPVYKFLCDLQNQDSYQPGWHWGVLENRPFLPQVRYGRFILSKARWILKRSEIKNSLNDKDEELLSAFTCVRKKRELPRYLQLTKSENELLLDLENIYCVRILLAEFNKSDSVTLVEFIETPDQCWIKSMEGNHTGEFIVAFSKIKKERNELSPTIQTMIHNLELRRVFPVGSEWLSARIYCGVTIGEKILTHVLRPLANDLLSKKLIDKFFFLRYYEEGYHIRIRFHNADKKDFWVEVISTLQEALQPFRDDRTVHDVQFETYRRELERYGFDTIELSEDLFCHHSKAIMEVNALLDGDEGEQYKWQVGLRAIDILLSDLGYNMDQKCTLIRKLDKLFSEEFKIGHTERKKIAEQYSEHKQRVKLLMSDAWLTEDILAKVIPVFFKKTEAYRRIVEGLLNAPSVKGNRDQLDNLMQSYLHMLINRLFVNSQRKTELVIYQYLLRYYESEIAREKIRSMSSIL
jgi:thiopeptide-type bacteriocin biosynthesis protein